MTNFTGLTTQQARCLHAIIRFIDDTGMSPQLDEIAAVLECSPQNVLKLVNHLEDKKRIKRIPHQERGITVVEKKDASLIKKTRRT